VYNPEFHSLANLDVDREYMGEWREISKFEASGTNCLQRLLFQEVQGELKTYFLQSIIFRIILLRELPHKRIFGTAE
jgi:hypothetical protein